MTGWIDAGLVLGSLVVSLIVTARATSRQGRAWWAWCLAAFALWAVVTLPNTNTSFSKWPWVLAVLIPWVPFVFLRYVLRGEERHACPHCRAKISVSASVCRYCQRDVTPAVSVP